MSVTSTGADFSARAARSPPNPPPTITTCLFMTDSPLPCGLRVPTVPIAVALEAAASSDRFGARQWRSSGARVRLSGEACEQHHHGAWLRAIAMAGNRGSPLPVDDIVRRIEEGVDPSAPWMAAAIGYQRELELERLPVCVEDEVKKHFFLREPCRERHAVRRAAPVRFVESHAVPANVGLPDQLVQRYPLPLGLHISQHPASVEQGHEPVHVGPLREQRPIEPAGLVVLTIGVVVAALGAPHLVAHQHHRHPCRQHRHREKVLYLSVPQFLDRLIFRRALYPTVPASVVADAVAIVLAIRLVVC